jgi:hypothetical protein
MPQKKMPQRAFETFPERKAAYAKSINPSEYYWMPEFNKPSQMKLDVKNTKYILALKGTGGGL